MEKKDLETEIRELFADAQTATELWLNERHLVPEILNRLGEFQNLNELTLEDIPTIPDEVASLPANTVRILQGGLDRLERFPELKSLYIQITPIPESFTIIDRLKELTINQSFQKAPVPSSIGTLVNLEKLTIEYTYTTDISVLKSLKKLKFLEIIDGKMESIAAIGELSELESLLISANTSYSIEPLKSCTNLKQLELEGEFSDLSPLSGLRQLKQLELEGEFSDLSPLSGLRQLKQLELDCDCTDVTPLSSLHALEELDLSMCFEITSIAPLLGLQNLKTFRAETHFMSQWETRNIPDSPEKIVSQIRQPAEVFQERMEGLIRYLHTFPENVKELLPVRIESVEELLAQIDEATVIRQFQKDFLESIRLLDDPETYEALRLEWYEGGEKNDTFAMGSSWKRCEGPFAYSGTDLIKVEGVTGIEMEEPRWKGSCESEMELDLTPVRWIWYKNIAVKFNKNEKKAEKSIAGTDLHKFYFDAERIFQELFLIKLYQMAGRAYDEIKENKPRFCFLSRHERWPVLISGF